MRYLHYCIMLLFLITIGAACKKKDNTIPANNTGTNATACNGKNFCMKVDGTLITHDATWKVLTDRYRIYWEEGSGNNYKNVELDIYATATGTYPIDPNPSPGKAGFQYYINDNGSSKNLQGQSGTIEIISISGNNITGKFTVTATANGTTYQVTEGNFVSVPQ